MEYVVEIIPPVGLWLVHLTMHNMVSSVHCMAQYQPINSKEKISASSEGCSICIVKKLKTAMQKKELATASFFQTLNIN